MQRLARERIPLTVCPLSNLRLCVFPDLEDHQLRRCWTRACGDDQFGRPGVFRRLHERELCRPVTTREEVMTLARNGFRAAFCDEATKQRHLKVLDAYSLSVV